MWDVATGQMLHCFRWVGGEWVGGGGVAIHGMVCIKYEVKWGGGGGED